MEKFAFQIAFPPNDPEFKTTIWEGFVDDVSHEIVIKDKNHTELFRIGGSSGISGNPNAIVYFSPSGNGTASSPKLIAAPVDQFGRPQIWDYRENGGVGSVFRQGAWQTDGDPSNQLAEGAVYYGKNANDVMSASEGGYARIKPDRFGLAQIITGVNGGNLFYAFRADYVTGLVLRNDLNVVGFEANRARGTVRTGSGITANRPAAVNIGEQWFDTSLGANGGKPIWYAGGGNWVDAMGNLV